MYNPHLMENCFANNKIYPLNDSLVKIFIKPADDMPTPTVYGKILGALI